MKQKLLLQVIRPSFYDVIGYYDKDRPSVSNLELLTINTLLASRIILFLFGSITDHVLGNKLKRFCL